MIVWLTISIVLACLAAFCMGWLIGQKERRK